MPAYPLVPQVTGGGSAAGRTAVHRVRRLPSLLARQHADRAEARHQARRLVRRRHPLHVRRWPGAVACRAGELPPHGSDTRASARCDDPADQSRSGAHPGGKVVRTRARRRAGAVEGLISLPQPVHPAGVMAPEPPRTTIVAMASEDVATGHAEIPGQREQERSHSGARRLIELELPGGREFDDPAYEWRRLFSEVLGTFLLVLAGAGGAVVNAQSGGQISRTAAVTAPGLTVLGVILFMGAVSGAHLNPAVSLGFAARGDFPWRRVPGYIVMQLVGATLACLFLRSLFGTIGSLGATEPGAGVTDWRAMLFELVLTAGLFSVILGTASRAQNVGPMSALGVAGYIALAGLWSSQISGASMNPARSFGPDLARWDFSHYLVSIVGPLDDTAIAVGIAYVLRGPADAGGAAAAQGRIGPPDVHTPAPDAPAPQGT